MSSAFGTRRGRTPSAVKWALGLIALAALLSCGGGGGSSGGPPASGVTGTGFAPSTGPGDASAYFPTAIGDQWTYNIANTSTNVAVSYGFGSATITGTQMVQGVTASVLQRVDPSSSSVVNNYYFQSGGGLTYLGDNDASDLVTPQVIPYVQLLYPVATGNQSTITATNLSDGKDSNGQPITVSFTQTINNQALGQSVSTSIGTYANALEQVTTISGSAKAAGQSTTISGTDTTWLVPQIGIVKEVTTTNVGGVASTETFDLRSYQLGGGSPHGVGSQTALPLPLTPFAGFGYTQRPEMASDGTNFLIAAQTSSAGAQGSWVAYLVDPSGTVITQVALDATAGIPGTPYPIEAVVAFDGTNYLVVYVQDNSATMLPPSLVAAQVSPTGQLLQTHTIVATYAYLNAGSNNLALGFDGSNYLLTYATSAQLNGQFISPATANVSGASFLIASSDVPMNPAVTFNGVNYLIAWDETSQGAAAPQGVDYVLLSTSGQMQAGPSSAYSISSNTTELGYPSVASGSSSFLIAYVDYRGNTSTYDTVSAARISSAGALLDGTSSTAGIHLSSTTGITNNRPAAIYNAANKMFQVAWGEVPIGTTAQITGATLLDSGTVVSAGADGFDVVRLSASNPIFGLSLATNGSGSTLIGWLPAANPIPIDLIPIYPP